MLKQEYRPCLTRRTHAMFVRYIRLFIWIIIKEGKAHKNIFLIKRIKRKKNSYRNRINGIERRKKIISFIWTWFLEGIVNNLDLSLLLFLFFLYRNCTPNRVFTCWHRVLLILLQTKHRLFHVCYHKKVVLRKLSIVHICLL